MEPCQKTPMIFGALPEVLSFFMSQKVGCFLVPFFEMLDAV